MQNILKQVLFLFK